MANIHNQTLTTGTRLGVYEIKETIKIDVFDITYRGWNHHLKEWVEIQEYFPYEFAIRANDGLGVDIKSSGDKEKFDYGLKEFLDQAEILTQIEHPNIVGTENVLQFNGTAYLITVNCEGLALSKVVHSPTSIPDTELNFILESILNALQKVHDHNIAHCGIQPETIILGNKGEALLTGFAGARIALAAHTAKLPDELIAGYTAPELYQQGNMHKPATDFYALGATLYYCIFHKQPAAYQDRLVALSKGDPDPVSLTESPAGQYNPALLQAIDWMLRPEVNDRPQSAIEVLARLKQGSAIDQDGALTSRHDSEAMLNNPSVAKNPLWIGVMAGIIGLVIAGFWLIKKTAEVDGNSINTVLSQPSLSPKDQDKQIVAAKAKDDTSVALSATTQSSQTPTPEIEINAPEKQAKPADEVLPQKSSAVEKPSKNSAAAESSNFPASQPVSKQEIKDKPLANKESGGSNKIAIINHSTHRPSKQKLPIKPYHQDSIEGYLAAAKKAMKEVRLTMPPGNNADHYYQLVLAKDPGNRAALAGRRKIVDRYAWVIRKAKADGDIEKAERVLKKAESVLPDDPKLQRIRAELQHQKK